MYAFARSAADAPWGPVVPLQAHIEYLITEGRGGRDSLDRFWERPQVAADLDAGLAWARAGGHDHAYALRDLGDPRRAFAKGHKTALKRAG